jgi:hypothetical protein
MTYFAVLRLGYGRILMQELRAGDEDEAEVKARAVLARLGLDDPEDWGIEICEGNDDYGWDADWQARNRLAEIVVAWILESDKVDFTLVTGDEPAEFANLTEEERDSLGI